MCRRSRVARRLLPRRYQTSVPRRNALNVSEMMTRGVRTCCPDDSLNSAAQLMWQNDCGCVPVVDSDGRAIGMITDRDICMAAYTQGQPLGDMLVASAASREIMTMRENESLDAAEALMQKHKIRRIPVVDADRRPVGIVSMNDLARHATVGAIVTTV